MCGLVLCEGCGSDQVVTTRADLPVCASCADKCDKYTLEGNESEQHALTQAMSELADLGVRWGDRAYIRENGVVYAYT